MSICAILPDSSTMIIAISAHPESMQVERFGHDFPVLLLEVEGQEVRSTRQLAPQAGCCGTLAKRLDGASVLICTGLGQGAARHLKNLGVDVAVVPDGVPLADALAMWTSQTLQTGTAEPTACHDHSEDASHSAGCGHGDDGASKPAHRCGCGSSDS